MLCPKCNSENIEGANFCAKCGANLKELATSPSFSNNQNANDVNLYSNDNLNKTSDLNNNVFMPANPTINPSNINNLNNVVNPTTNSNVNILNNLDNNINPPTDLSNMPNNINPNDNKNKKNNKILLIILGILFIGLIILGVNHYFKTQKDPELVNLVKVFDPRKSIIIKKEDKYGYITSEGKMLIEPKYNEASNFEDNYAIVRTKNLDKNDYYNYYIYNIIDKKGKVIKTSHQAPYYYSNNKSWIIEEKLYNAKFKPILSSEITVTPLGDKFLKYRNPINDETGIMNSKGKVILKSPLKDPHISISISNNQYNSKDLYAYMYTTSPKKHVILSLKTKKSVYEIPSNISDVVAKGNGIFYFYENNDYDTKTYYYFVNGKLRYKSPMGLEGLEIYDYKKQILKIDNGYDYYDKGKKSRYEYYDIKKNQVLFDNQDTNFNIENKLNLENYGFKKFENSSKYGLTNGKKVILPAEYNDIEFISLQLFQYMKRYHHKELILLKKDDKKILMDIKHQKAIVTFDKDMYIHSYNDSTFIKIYSFNKDTIIYNVLTGAKKKIDKDANINIYSNYIIIQNENNARKEYYNTKLAKIYEVNK